MGTYYVTKVRKQAVASKDGAYHEHIVGVVTNLDIFYTNKEVSDSIDAGHDWYTAVDKEPRAKIKKLRFCSGSGCLHSPYLTTNPDHTTRNNLENLPRG
ncbi:DUF3892 domain-containing protein [Sorangium sp. So ce1097]|uniref:DUF3892 domain-containing protein n=1 Tax=Sorangium sp. So ce1097 TaxID=3133330 RepID=UPI003F626D8B